MSSVPLIPGIKAEESLAIDYRREVAALLGRKKTAAFPGSQPVSFSRKHFKTLAEEDFYLTEKSDGVRLLLYCTVDEHGNEIHYFIDRRNDYYFQQPGSLHFPVDQKINPQSMFPFHAQTLLDGELVWDRMKDGSQKLRFLVFDCLVLDEIVLINRSLSSRIGYFKEFFLKPYQHFLRSVPVGTDFIFEVVIKTFEKAYGIEMMFRDVLPSLAHGNDGLIFTCRNTPYIPGTDENILKWKPADENTVDFLLVLGEFPRRRMSDFLDGNNNHANGKDEDIMDTSIGDDDFVEDFDAKPTLFLHVYCKANTYENFAELYITDDEWEMLKSLSQPLDRRIVECRWESLEDPLHSSPVAFGSTSPSSQSPSAADPAAHSAGSNHHAHSFTSVAGRWRLKIDPDGRPRFRDDKGQPNHSTVVSKVLKSIEDAVSEYDLLAAVPAIYSAWKKRHPEEQRQHSKSSSSGHPPQKHHPPAPAPPPPLPHTGPPRQ